MSFLDLHNIAKFNQVGLYEKLKTLSITSDTKLAERGEHRTAMTAFPSSILFYAKLH